VIRMLFPENIDFINEEEKEKFFSAYDATIECVKKLLPTAETEMDDNLGIHIWIPYTDLDYDDNLVDRGINVGVVWFIDRDTQNYITKEEVCNQVKQVISRFIFVQKQICDAISRAHSED